MELPGTRELRKHQQEGRVKRPMLYLRVYQQRNDAVASNLSLEANVRNLLEHRGMAHSILTLSLNLYSTPTALKHVLNVLQRDEMTSNPSKVGRRS